MKEIMSYGNNNKSTVYDAERKFEHFQNIYENIVSKVAGRHLCPQQQEDAELAQAEPCRGVGGEGLAS
jgi:hypothetical protein